MRKQYIVFGGLAGVVIAGGLVYAAISTVKNRDETQRQLDDLKRQILAQNQPGTPPPAIASTSFASAGTAPANNTTVDRLRNIHDALTEGARLLATKKPADAAVAAKIYQEALDKLDPDNLSFYLGLGHANLQRNEPAQAAHVFLQAIAKSNNRSEFWNGLGQAYWDLKDYFHAKAAYEQAISLDPKSVPAWTVMAWVYLGLGDQVKATKGFQVLNDSGSDRLDWKMGLAMARSSNFQLDQIRSQFPLPDPQLFLTPPPATTIPAP